MIDFNPIEMAWVGTSSFDWKKREFASIVDSVKSTIEVIESNEVPGSLNPTWPLIPSPNNWISIPPAAAMAASYLAASSFEVIAPLGTWVFSLLMLMWSNKFFVHKVTVWFFMSWF
jgi:hypothetical protein